MYLIFIGRICPVRHPTLSRDTNDADDGGSRHPDLLKYSILSSAGQTFVLVRAQTVLRSLRIVAAVRTSRY